MIIDLFENLYRYDLENPPMSWEQNFINPKYNYKKLGQKNVANLFFFTNSMQIAKELGNSQCKNSNRKGYYLTTCNTIGSIKIIDFSGSNNIYQMICTLIDTGIDIFTDSFQNYDEDVNFNTFKGIKPYFENAELESDMFKKLSIIQNIKLHPNSSHMDVGLFGQRLTDFNNGIIFKKILQEKGIDGYRWKEFENDEGLTYCLCDSLKLSDPSKTYYDITGIKY